MEGLSSPGPNSLPTVFYQKRWPIIGPQVCEAVLLVLNSNSSIVEINGTFITLIPQKKKRPLLK